MLPLTFILHEVCLRDQRSRDQRFEPRQRLGQPRVLIPVAGFVIEDGDEVVDERQEIDLADLVAGEGRFERQRRLRHDRLSIERDQPVRGLRRKILVLDAEENLLPGGCLLLARLNQPA